MLVPWMVYKFVPGSFDATMGGTRPERGTIRSKMIAGFCFLQAPFSNDASFREISVRVDPLKVCFVMGYQRFMPHKKERLKGSVSYFSSHSYCGKLFPKQEIHRTFPALRPIGIIGNIFSSQLNP